MNLSTENSVPEQEKSEVQLNLEILRALPYFERLPIELMKAVAYLSKRVNYKQDALLFEQDEFSDQALFVLSGTAEVVRRSGEGEAVLGELGPETFIGGLALAAHVKRLFSLRAKTPVSCIVLSRGDFWPTIMQNPQATALFMEALAQRIIQWEEQFINSGACKENLDLVDVGVSLL